MAEILRALGPQEAGAFMPMREMHAERRNEVYEAVGEHLAALYELDEDLVEEGCFLVQLEDQRLVAFSYGIGGTIEVPACEEPAETGGRAIRHGAFMAFVTHWQHYDRTPVTDRIGDEDGWDRLFPEILAAVGVDYDEALGLCEAAKMEARLL